MERKWKRLRRARQATDFTRLPFPVKAPPECLHCGACCFSPAERFVRVSGDDWARLGAEAEHVAHFIGHRAYMKMNDGHCAALEVRRDAGGRTEFFCTLYERRPQICRDLARGSPECQGERTLGARR